ncbi:shikimate kinase [Corynebacterium pseudopelargi]|uniref:Shikimate kinase n=1 Tax=Corynebacterium pseudopelargi TaxID=2080757 RepID=A0A3G6ITV1_9CORY|nr:Shikimate kinase [Corynebacterium pseudopelargi]
MNPNPGPSKSQITYPLVVLIGPPGAGKTTVGRRLARALSTTFVDSDELIEQQEGESCASIIQTRGEPAFRELEARKVAEALRSQGVVSLGGGAVETEKVRHMLQDHNVVWIDISLEEGLRRTNDPSRPLLQSDDRAATYAAMLQRREPLFKQASKVRVRTHNRSPQRVVADILDAFDDELSNEADPASSNHTLERSEQAHKGRESFPGQGFDQHQKPQHAHLPPST